MRRMLLPVLLSVAAAAATLPAFAGSPPPEGGGNEAGARAALRMIGEFLTAADSVLDEAAADPALAADFPPNDPSPCKAAMDSLARLKRRLNPPIGDLRLIDREFRVLAYAGCDVPGSESAETLAIFAPVFVGSRFRAVIPCGVYWAAASGVAAGGGRAAVLLVPLALRFESLPVLGIPEGLAGHAGAVLGGKASIGTRVPAGHADSIGFSIEGFGAPAGLWIAFQPDRGSESKSGPSPAVSSAAAAAATLLFAAAAWVIYRRTRNPGPGRFAAFASICVLFRLSLAVAGFPESLGGRLFEGSAFRMDLPPGLGASPVGFLLTAAAASAVIIMFLRHAWPAVYPFAERQAAAGRRWIPAFAALPASFAVPLIAAAFLAITSATVRSSGFSYFPPGRIWHDEAGTVMLVPHFLSAIFSVLLATTAANTVFRMVQAAGAPIGAARAAAALLVCAATALAAVWPGISATGVFISATALATFLLHSMLKKDLYSFNHVVLFLLSATLFCFPALREENEAMTRERVEAASRGLKEARASLEGRLAAAIRAISGDREAAEIASETPVPKFLPALILSRSMLVSPETSCHVRLMRFDEISVGDCSFNMPFGRESGGTVDAGWEHPSPADFAGLKAGAIIGREGLGDYRGLLLHTARAAVGDPTDNLAAYVTAGVLWPFPRKRGLSPALDAPFGLGEEAANLVISRYSGGRLLLSTSKDLQVNRPLSASAAVSGQDENPAWVEEDAPGGILNQVLIPDGPGSAGATAIGYIRQVGWKYVLDFLRLLVFNMAAGGTLFLAFMLLILPYNPEMRGLLRLRFKYSLLISYLFISILPIVALLYTIENMTARRVTESVKEDLDRSLDIFAPHNPPSPLSVIREEVDSSPTGYSKPGMYAEKISRYFDDEVWYATRSDMLGRDFDVYMGNSFFVGAACDPCVNLLSSRVMPEEVFSSLILGGERLVFQGAGPAGGGRLTGFLRLQDASGRTFGALAASRIMPEAEIRREISTQLSIILTVYLLTLVGVGGMAVALARRISRPMERLTAATREVAGGNLDHRIMIDASGEIGELVESFNRMTEELKDNRAKIISAEKESAWREMARQIAHEIKNPLTPMKLSTSHIIKAHRDRHPRFDAILAEGLDRIAAQIDALGKIASEFSNFARFPARKLEPQDLNSIVSSAVRLVEEEARGSRPEIRIEESYGALPEVEADRDEMQRVVINLLKNAVQALRDRGGAVRVSTRRVGADAAKAAGHVPASGKEEGTRKISKTGRDLGPGAEAAEISIEDDGPGIPEEIRQRLFEPYFSTKSGGTGLGLAICKSSVTEMGGEIVIESEEGKGTRAIIRLPAMRRNGHDGKE